MQLHKCPKEFCPPLYIKSTFALLFLHWMLCKQIAKIKTNNCSLAVRPPSQMVSSWFDTKLFQCKSFRYNSKSQSEVTIRYKSYLAVWNYHRISMLIIDKRITGRFVPLWDSSDFPSNRAGFREEVLCIKLGKSSFNRMKILILEAWNFSSPALLAVHFFRSPPPLLLILKYANFQSPPS